MKHSIGQTRNNIAVYVDLIQSHAAKQISQHPKLLSLIAEVLKQTALKGATVEIEHDMGRTIGYSFVIKTTESDGVFYAQLLKEDSFTRFVKNGKPLLTKYLSMTLHQAEDGTYDLSDARIGRLSPPRPGTAEETTASKAYWASHAIIFGNEPLQLRTITKVRPY